METEIIIELKIKDVKVKLTLDEIKELKLALEQIAKDEKIIFVDRPIYYTTQNQYPYITWTSSSTKSPYDAELERIHG